MQTRDELHVKPLPSRKKPLLSQVVPRIYLQKYFSKLERTLNHALITYNKRLKHPCIVSYFIISLSSSKLRLDQRVLEWDKYKKMKHFQYQLNPYSFPRWTQRGLWKSNVEILNFWWGLDTFYPHKIKEKPPTKEKITFLSGNLKHSSAKILLLLSDTCCYGSLNIYLSGDSLVLHNVYFNVYSQTQKWNKHVHEKLLGKLQLTRNWKLWILVE